MPTEPFVTINDAVTAFMDLLQPHNSELESEDQLSALDKSSQQIRLGFDLMLNRDFFEII